MIVRFTRTPSRCAACSREPAARSASPQRVKRRQYSRTSASATATRKATGIGPMVFWMSSVIVAEMKPPWNGRSSSEIPCRPM